MSDPAATIEAAQRMRAREAPLVAVADGLPTPNRYWTILTIALGLTLAVLNGAIANVALPAISVWTRRKRGC
jgi:hypothetical protein